MVKITCMNCGRALGKFEGKGEIKCTGRDCYGTNVFDTKAGNQSFVKKKIHIPLAERKTSSGVTFW